MIEVNNLRKKIGDHEILKRVNLTVNSGSICGIIGENGVGKTTLLRCMSGIYSNDSGEIIYDGLFLENDMSVKSRVSYLCDEFNFFSNYKVKDILKFYDKLYPRFSYDKFDFYNHTFEISTNQRIYTLSKGMKMKLNLMLSLSNGSDYLLLDEPINGLDVMSKNSVLKAIITKASDDNTTIVISSHNLDELEKVCDTIVFMKDGAIALTSDLEAVKDSIVGVQAVFMNGVPSDLYNMSDVLDVKQVIGKVVYLSTNNYCDKLLKQLKSMGASSIEKVDMTLEEIFISSYEGWKKNE